jgi:hypothetical protein
MKMTMPMTSTTDVRFSPTTWRVPPALALGATAALADSPHFIKASATINSSGQLVCSFKEASSAPR